MADVEAATAGGVQHAAGSLVQQTERILDDQNVPNLDAPVVNGNR